MVVARRCVTATPGQRFNGLTPKQGECRQVAAASASASDFELNRVGSRSPLNPTYAARCACRPRAGGGGAGRALCGAAGGHTAGQRAGARLLRRPGPEGGRGDLRVGGATWRQVYGPSCACVRPFCRRTGAPASGRREQPPLAASTPAQRGRGRTEAAQSPSCCTPSGGVEQRVRAWRAAPRASGRWRRTAAWSSSCSAWTRPARTTAQLPGASRRVHVRCGEGRAEEAQRLMCLLRSLLRAGTCTRSWPE